ncbi:MAG: diguanylate cyclase [Oscillospiraceae bacterium]
MKSIRSKFIAFTLIITLLSSAFVGCITVRNMSVLSDTGSVELINHMVLENASTVDGLLGRIEQSVDVLAGCIDDYIKINDSKPDSIDLNAISDYIDPILYNAGQVTDGCIGVYIRYNTDISGSIAGIFYTKSAEDANLKAVPCTDLSLYDSDDIEHVGWYYVPKAAGKPTWMLPYFNQNINVYMISYVIPLYIDDAFIGIVGMDIDFTMLESLVLEITAYDTGYAYLTDKDFNIISHPNLSLSTTPEQENIIFEAIYSNYSNITNEGNLYHYNYHGDDKVFSYRTLRNGLNLCIAVPRKDINKNLNRTITHIVVFAIVATVITVLVTIIITSTITKPLKKLTQAAKVITDGNLDINIDIRSKDEIGLLAATLQKTKDDLSVYIRKMNRLAYMDSLTGVENKTAYDMAVAEYNILIDEKKADFAVVVLDLNNLKKTNDTMGHYYGDMLITNSARLIESSFIGCPVYRIGGDEFVVIINGTSHEQHKALYQNFEAALTSQRTNGRECCISIAYGMAEFDSETDHSFSDVFTRADNAMYIHKKKSKEEMNQ